MSLQLTPEQEDLRESVRRFVAEGAAKTSVREAVDGDGLDMTTWKTMNDKLALAGLAIPESQGGSGASHTDISVVFQQLGRGLVPSPLLSTVLAAELLLRLGDQAVCDEYLPRMARGEIIGALAVMESRTSLHGWIPERVAACVASGPKKSLTGVKTMVINGQHADFFLVLASSEEGTPQIFLVDARAEGLSVTALSTLDLARSVAVVTFDGVAARPVAGDAMRALKIIADTADLYLASEQIGGFEECLSMTARYASERVAFGRTIGSYQGVKHPLANMLVAWEIGYSAVREASRCADTDSENFTAAAAAARWLVSGPYFDAATKTVQLHGGIGYTWEHDAHLYYRNAKSQEHLMGNRRSQLERLAGALTL